jgi:hypothetical protein
VSVDFVAAVGAGKVYAYKFFACLAFGGLGATGSLALVVVSAIPADQVLHGSQQT